MPTPFFSFNSKLLCFAALACSNSVITITTTTSLRVVVVKVIIIKLLVNSHAVTIRSIFSFQTQKLVIGSSVNKRDEW